MAALFYIAAGVTILAALGVVLQKAPVYSALSLIVVLCALAVLYLLLGAEFMAAVQVIVYAGAIMVLFVLVIMLLNARREAPGEARPWIPWLGVPLLILFLGEVLFVVWKQFPSGDSWSATPPDGSPGAIGALLFRNYVLPFELTSILILVAILGAVVLAKREV